MPVTVTAPAGARTPRMRFKNWDRGGCTAYDPGASYFYTFSIQQ